MSAEGEYEYDVAFSFASEDREYVRLVSEFLHRKSIKVFYDEFKEGDMWGRKLGDYFDSIFKQNAKYCVVYISKYYARKVWTMHEFRAALARAAGSTEFFILPARFDNSELDGLPTTLKSVDISGRKPEQFAEIVASKISKDSNTTFLSGFTKSAEKELLQLQKQVVAMEQRALLVDKSIDAINSHDVWMQHKISWDEFYHLKSEIESFIAFERGKSSALYQAMQKEQLTGYYSHKSDSLGSINSLCHWKLILKAMHQQVNDFGNKKTVQAEPKWYPEIQSWRSQIVNVKVFLEFMNKTITVKGQVRGPKCDHGTRAGYPVCLQLFNQEDHGISGYEKYCIKSFDSSSMLLAGKQIAAPYDLVPEGIFINDSMCCPLIYYKEDGV